jgi:hypothetical protein
MKIHDTSEARVSQACLMQELFDHHLHARSQDGSGLQRMVAPALRKEGIHVPFEGLVACMEPDPAFAAHWGKRGDIRKIWRCRTQLREQPRQALRLIDTKLSFDDIHKKVIAKITVTNQSADAAERAILRKLCDHSQDQDSARFNEYVNALVLSSHSLSLQNMLRELQAAWLDTFAMEPVMPAYSRYRQFMARVLSSLGVPAAHVFIIIDGYALLLGNPALKPPPPGSPETASSSSLAMTA